MVSEIRPQSPSLKFIDHELIAQVCILRLNLLPSMLVDFDVVSIIVQNGLHEGTTVFVSHKKDRISSACPSGVLVFASYNKHQVLQAPSEAWPTVQQDMVYALRKASSLDEPQLAAPSSDRRIASSNNVLCDTKTHASNVLGLQI